MMTLVFVAMLCCMNDYACVGASVFWEEGRGVDFYSHV